MPSNLSGINWLGKCALTASSEVRTGKSKARMVFALLTLFIFTVQTSIIQTHVHLWSIGSQTTWQAPSGHTAPTDDGLNPDNCPICQAYSLVGNFAATIFVIFIPTLSFLDAAPFPSLPAAGGAPLTRSWQSRAPPID
jgi:hypothetical protein